MLSASDDISISYYGKLSLVHIRNFLIITDVLPWKKCFPCEQPRLLALRGSTRSTTIVVCYLEPLYSTRSEGWLFKLLFLTFLVHKVSLELLKTLFVEIFFCFAPLDSKHPHFLGLVSTWTEMLSSSLRFTTSVIGGHMYPSRTLAISDVFHILLWY